MIADGDIGGDGGGGAGAGGALEDGEAPCRQRGGQRPLFDRDDAGQGRRLVPEGIHKRCQLIAARHGPDDHAVTGIGDRAGDPEAAGEVVDKGSKPYALDDAADEDFDPDLPMPWYG